MTGGRTCVVVETSPPGGGPPPHSHQNEDETFYILEGEYEILSEGQWHKFTKGEGAHSNRGAVHTFRNSGPGPGKILIVISPAGFENTSRRFPSFPSHRTCRSSSPSPTDTASSSFSNSVCCRAPPAL